MDGLTNRDMTSLVAGDGGAAAAAAARLGVGLGARRWTQDGARSVLSGSGVGSYLPDNPMLEDDDDEAAAEQQQQTAAQAARAREERDMAAALAAAREEDVHAMLQRAMGMGPVEMQREREAVVVFTPWIFVRELVVHTFQFVSVPLLYLIGGYNQLWNRQFVGGPAALLQLVLLVCYIVAHVVWAIERPLNVSVYEIVLLNAAWLIRNAVVAIKWAYMSPREIDDLIGTRVPMKELTDKQIIAGWARPTRQTLERQLELACIRQKLELHRYVFEVRSEDAHVGSLTRDRLRHSAFKVALQILIDAVRNSQQLPVFLFCLAAGLVHTFIPVIVRAILRQPVFGGSSYTEWAPYVFFATSGFCQFFLVYSNSAFTIVGLEDFQRRVYMAKKLNQVISHSYVRSAPALRKSRQMAMDEDEDDCLVTSTLHIDLSVPKNVLGWYSVRQVLRDVGLAFYRRINAYAAVFAIYVLGLVVLMIVALLASDFIPVDGILVVYVIFDVLLFLVLVLLILLAGSSTNYFLRSHAWHCANKQFDMLQTLADKNSTLSPDEREELLHAANILSTAVDVIDADNKINKVTLLGFEASGQFAGTFAAVASTGLAAAAKGVSDTFF